ncbi:MAG: cytosine permease, partial [Woeseiaceae bacterium]
GGILFVDYFFLRRQKINLRAIYDSNPNGEYYFWKGFNVLALAGIVIGQLTYFYLYNPFTDASHWLFNILPASIAAFLVPALFYGVGMQFYTQKALSDDAQRKLIRPNI